MSKRAISYQGKDGRRKHSHWHVLVTYSDKEVFGRVYLDLEKAEKFAARQMKSPVVSSVRVVKLS
ncbi:MAG TPA: hypothetical protein VK525_23650 [Candidatus Saccharimonadales bacterium]|nr:hypothetical protein [Candidatus Saccharimonadales bacterium]